MPGRGSGGCASRRASARAWARSTSASPARRRPTAKRGSISARCARTGSWGGGQPFRQEEWEAAKRTAVRELAGWRYAAASITASRAAVDPAAHRADLVVELASGPPFRFGELKVNGTKRYTDRLIENLTPVRPGEPYDREKVILYQRRLLESGYFASVQADIDADPRLADAAPLRVGVIDAPKHHFESGIGDNTDVGSRITPRY